MLLPRPPASLVPDTLDRFLTRSGETEENPRLVEIVAPHWNAIVDQFKSHGPKELRKKRKRLKKRLEHEDRLVQPLRMESVLLQRLREAYEFEAQTHGPTKDVAGSVVVDLTAPEDRWWVWRALSPSTLILEVTKSDEVWESFQHPHSLTRAYDGEKWHQLIERVCVAQEILSARMSPMLACRDEIRFRLDLITKVLKQHDLGISVDRIDVETTRSKAPQRSHLTAKEIEFVKTALEVLEEHQGKISRSKICMEVDTRMEARLKEKPDLIGGETWRDRDAKLLAQDLGIYVIHDKKGRLPRAQEVQALQVFQDGIRELAERIREADVNNAGNKGDVTE